MEDKIQEVSPQFSEEELLQRQYDQRMRELLISRARANVVKSQIVKAYEGLENIRFDFVSDTDFRDKIVRAKRNLETALNDFLLRDEYWEERISEHRKMTPVSYAEFLEKPITQSGEKA